MSKITDFFMQHLDGNSDLQWPSDPEDLTTFARKLFGLGFVSAHDSWLKTAKEVLEGSADQKRALYVGEREARRQLSGLSPEQRDAVRWLLQYTVDGAIFSSLVSIDQFPRAEVEVLVRPFDDNMQPLESFGPGIRIAPAMMDLHDDLSGWLEDFSEFGVQELEK